MFGYIKPAVPELKVREHEYYRRIYCAVCRSNGKTTGCSSRFALRYDLVFLALVRMALAGEVPEYEERRCPAHPFRRHPTAALTPSMAYAARAGALLTYYNLLDKIADAAGIRKLPYLLLRPFAAYARRRALRQSGGTLDREIAKELERLHVIERGEVPASPDIAAECFGDLLRTLFGCELDPASPAARIAGEIGYHTGRWIYLTDAADDLASDRKSGSYNPFAEEENDGLGERIRCALIAELTDLERAVSLIDFPCPENRALVENILYLGMPDAAARAIAHGIPAPSSDPPKNKSGTK